MVKLAQRRNLLFVRHYFYLISERTIFHLQLFGQFWGIFILTAFIAFIFLSNSAPLGITVQYAMEQNSEQLSPLGPKNRVQTITIQGQQASKITDDLVYFITEAPFQFDSATVKIFYQNPDPDQTFSVGFQDQQTWHYASQPFHVPFLNALNWSRLGNNPTLFQRKQSYPSVDAFLQNPPQDAVIGTYDYNTDIGNTSQTLLDNYTPSKQDTVISTPLRGKQTMYVYLDKEPFKMTVTKQDLNWYEGPDPVTISIYKANDLVYQDIIPDDGIINTSQKSLPPQQFVINSPGPGLPESGVYKVVLDATDDTIINSITTNLHKIVFAGSLFLAGNHNSYGTIASTSASTLYTNALSLSAETYHNSGKQIIQVDNQQINLYMLQTPVTVTPQNDISKIFVPFNDVTLDAFQGYFSFSPDQFFLPTKYHLMQIITSDDAKLADYILADYYPPQKENGWEVNEQTYDLSTAYVKNNKLSWVIQAPHLKENGHSILIKDIQITFHKKGWNGQ